MGCDIHLVVERRVRRGGLPDQWVAVRVILHGFETAKGRGGIGSKNYAWPLGIEQNYDRFAALAGVRGIGPQARGLPDDASDTTRLLFKISGYHTPSWLPLIEAARIFADTERGGSDRKYPEFHYFNIDAETDGPVDDHRVVFGFDS